MIELGGVALVLVGVAVGAAVEARRRARRNEVFRDLAHRLDARFEEPVSVLGFPGAQPALEVVVEQAVVRLELVRQASSANISRARARYALGAGPRFQVAPRGAWTARVDLVIDDDDRFRMAADDPERARALWTARTRRLATALRWVVLESDGETVTATVAGVDHDPRTLESLLDLVGDVASHGMRALLPLAELPGARLVGPLGPWDDPRAAHVEVAGAGGIVRIAALPGRAGPQLALTLDDARERRPFSVRIEGGQLLDEAPRGSIPPSAAALLEPLGSATLLGNDEWLRLVFASVPPDDAVHAGVRLLFELVASTARGVFR